MQARDASGRQVSLLNDGQQQQQQPPQPQPQRPLPARPLSYHQTAPAGHHHHHVFSHPSPALRSNSSSPNMPELLRSDSYDSQTSNDPISPMTPSVDYIFPRTSSASIYPVAQDYPVTADAPIKRPAYVTESRASSFEDEAAAAAAAAAMSGASPSSAAAAAAAAAGGASMAERPGKRYPCRYRESHGCEKTFTTSGHASRHSKIHTAEKAVQCTFHGCQKKFTRADNMKQHLETHYKDKGHSAGQRTQKAAVAALAGPRRHSASGPVRQHARWLLPPPAAWDMRGLDLPLLNRPAAPVASPSSGLDALAMAIACQEGKS
ncbi:LOW QUALITY PROTEIN: ZnF C2H2 [Geosmithia morbida]|uniref:ZnF C2H2 n=1 Tax=Geosmithia morbida TaxID=1094350 RepID=A0A9P4YVL0_9HYPO|nr:LOW QUALITY PROTEIN: ZnF C2H2 [Geosmithia morbida]KAF4122617.1 LOW QUALITY PROTEIN: ZnF C2H2 [Geosmithia morbida]